MMKNEILNDKHFQVLKRVQSKVPNAVIAGGAARDLYFNKPFENVDIFMQGNTIRKMGGGVQIFFEDILPEVLSCDIGGDDSYEYRDSNSLYFNGMVEKVYNAVISDTQYRFIAVSKVMNIILESFDINLCKIFHDGKELRTTKIFDSAIESKEIWVNEINRYSARRVMSILKKYPEFRIRKDQEEEITKQSKKPIASDYASFAALELNRIDNNIMDNFVQRPAPPPQPNPRDGHVGFAWPNPHGQAQPIPDEHIPQGVIVHAPIPDVERIEPGEWVVGGRAEWPFGEPAQQAPEPAPLLPPRQPRRGIGGMFRR